MAGDRTSSSNANNKSPCKPRVNDGSLILPLARVKTIMKSSPDVENISSDALFFVTKATELFIEHLIQEIYQNMGKQKELTYNGLADIVQTCDSMEFLKEMVPRKISMKEYYRFIEKDKVKEEY